MLTTLICRIKNLFRKTGMRPSSISSTGSILAGLTEIAPDGTNWIGHVVSTWSLRQDKLALSLTLSDWQLGDRWSVNDCSPHMVEVEGKTSAAPGRVATPRCMGVSGARGRIHKTETKEVRPGFYFRIKYWQQAF
jgi:hypothetical protein